MKLKIKFALSLALSVVFLYLAFKNVDLRAMWRHIGVVRVEHVALYVASLVLVQLCRVYRWELLTRPFAPLAGQTLFKVANLGMMMILLLPLRLGELARPYLLKKVCGASLSSGLGASAVERTLDGLVVTLLFFACPFLLGGQYPVPAALWAGAYIALAIFVAAALVIGLSLVTHGFVPQLLRRVGAGWAPHATERAIGVLNGFVAGFRALPSGRSVVGLVLWTLAVWLLTGLGFFVVVRGFGWDLPVTSGFVVMSVISIAIMIPAGPGFLGTFQGAILASLSMFGIGATEAAAYGAVVYPINVVVVVAFGLPYLFGRGARARVADMLRASSAEAA